MTSETKMTAAEATNEAARETWVEPAIMTFDAVDVTEANLAKAGDFINSLS